MVQSTEERRPVRRAAPARRRPAVDRRHECGTSPAGLTVTVTMDMRFPAPGEAGSGAPAGQAAPEYAEYSGAAEIAIAPLTGMSP